MSKFIERIKIGILGQTRVGKTHFLHNFLYGSQAKQHISPTIAVQFYEQIISLKSQQVSVRIWDSSGMEKYKGIIGHHLKECQVLILMYDMTNRESFLNLQTRLQQLKVQGAVLNDKIIMIVGNKVDLIKQHISSREIQDYQIKILLKKYKLSMNYIYEVCSKVGNQKQSKIIKQIVNNILVEILERRNEDAITSMRVKLGEQGIIPTQHQNQVDKDSYCGQCNIF